VGLSPSFRSSMDGCMKVNRRSGRLRLQESHRLLVVVVMGEGRIEEVQLVVWFGSETGQVR